MKLYTAEDVSKKSGLLSATRIRQVFPEFEKSGLKCTYRIGPNKFFTDIDKAVEFIKLRKEGRK